MVRFRLCQIGYALVFFFLVPLGDLLENRKLMIATALVSDASPADAGMTESPSGLLITSLLIGFSSVSVQILIPLAAHLASEESRVRVVGGIMVSSLLGVLLARPVSSLIADHFGWRSVGCNRGYRYACQRPFPTLVIPNALRSDVAGLRQDGGRTLR